MTHLRRATLTALLSGLPAVAVALTLLWGDAFSAKVRWTLSALMLGAWVGLAVVLREQIVRPIQVISNMLGALRQGDATVRAVGASAGDDLGIAMLEVNALADVVRERQLGAVEATTLLQRVMSSIDVAVFAFDRHDRLQLVNSAGEALLGASAAELAGASAAELQLGGCLEGPVPRVISVDLPGGAGRWEVRRSAFRQGGRPHRLVVLSDVQRALRSEQRQAWQRLIRVLGHEINNSLAPIQSIAGSVRARLEQVDLSDDLRADVDRGLAVIGDRSRALARFMGAYARLAKLPPPTLGAVGVGAWVRRVAALEDRVPVTIAGGPEITIEGDGDQLDQLLINLVQNAADAAIAGAAVAGEPPRVVIAWALADRYLELSVSDNGLGVANPENLFVPFFTTKPGGSGIGLVLSRQIAEAHDGALTLQSRAAGGEDGGSDNGSGAVARLRLPR